MLRPGDGWPLPIISIRIPLPECFNFVCSAPDAAQHPAGRIPEAGIIRLLKWESYANDMLIICK